METVSAHRLLPRRNDTAGGILLNALLAAVSLFVNGFGVYLTIQANIGAGPWDVLNLGVSRIPGLRAEGHAAGRPGQAREKSADRRGEHRPFKPGHPGRLAAGRPGRRRHADLRVLHRPHHAACLPHPPLRRNRNPSPAPQGFCGGVSAELSA